MSKKTDRYIIIGAGIMGLSVAWALMRRGVKDITVLEQSTIPNPLGASGDEHRIIRRAYGTQSAYGFMISDAFRAWEMLWQDLGENHLDMRGFAILSRADGDEGAAYINGLEKDGFTFEDLTADALDQRFPFVSQNGLARAIYSLEGGILYSHKIALGLKKLLTNEGVTFIEQIKAEAIMVETGEVTCANGHIVKADQIIVTAGAWVQSLMPDHVQPLLPRQTYAIFLKPPQHLEKAWQNAPPFVDVGDHVDGYVLPPGNGCDLKFGAGLTRADFDTQKLVQNVTNEEAKFLRNAFGKAFSEIEKYEILRSRRCAYTFTKDDRFWANQKGRVTVLSACSGHGYKFGSLIGLTLADSVLANDFDRFATWLAGHAQ